MSSYGSDKVFAGSVPELYDTHLVPLIFEPYAADLAARLALRPLGQVLEIAAGTGCVTRAMATALPETVAIVATDLSQAMLDQTAARGTTRPVRWRQADAMALPFADGAFDAVVCQFGVMFFPEKGGAYAEVRRVLRSGGIFVFNVWDRIEENEFADTVTTALAALFPEDPPRFLARTPHGYHDPETIKRDLTAGGFPAAPAITTLAAEPGGVLRACRRRVLPGHPAAQRDRGAGCLAADGGYRPGSGSDRTPVWPQDGGGQYPSTRHHHCEVTVTKRSTRRSKRRAL